MNDMDRHIVDARQPDSRVVLVNVRAALPNLRPAERRIAELLLADPSAFSTRSIGEVAVAAATSTTTVVRFYRRIGYQRFQDLRLDLTREVLRERLAHADIDAVQTDIDPNDSLDEIVAKVAVFETLSISDTSHVLDPGHLREAVGLVAAADRVDLFGVGASSIVSLDLQRKLSRIGRTAIEWPDAHSGWTAAATLHDRSVAIAISHSGATEDTVRFLEIASAQDAATIAITNHADSPLARAAQVVLLTAARETRFRSGALGSRIAQLMVADCLFIGVAQTSFEKSTNALRVTYDTVRTRGVGR
jgi:DNA-binding MurR/RpiR family transcriptional regulator